MLTRGNICVTCAVGRKGEGYSGEVRGRERK